MIRRLLWLMLLGLLSSLPTLAQQGFTVVSGTVVDSNGSVYSNATFNVGFVNPGTPAGVLPLLNGSTFQQQYVGVVTDSFGRFSLAIPDNNVIALSGALNTQWNFSFCSVLYPAPNQKYCFNTNLTITGPTMNISTQLTAAAAILPPIGGGATLAFLYTQATPATSWEIVHNLNTPSVTFDCFDANQQYVVPDTVTNTNVNTLMVTFTVAQAGTCIVLGAGAASSTSGGGGATLTATQNGFGSSGNALTGDPTYTFNSTTKNEQVPSINQTIYIDGVKYPQSDIGAGINAAYAALPANGGTIIIPASATCYQTSTAMNFATEGKFPLIVSSPGGSACIQWTSTTGTAITFNSGEGVLATHPRAFGLRDIELVGPNGSTGPTNICTSLSGVTATALLLGGTNGAEGFGAYGININCFGTGVTYGNNTWGTLFKHGTIRNNTKDLNITGSLSNTGEQLAFDEISWIYDLASAPACVVNMNPTGITLETEFVNNSFDGAEFCPLGISHLINPHFENPGNNMTFPFIVNSANLEILGGTFLEDYTSTFVPNEYIANTGNNAVLLLHGFNAYAGSVLSYFVGDANNAVTNIDGLMTGTFSWSAWINHTGTGTCLIDGYGTASGVGDFYSCQPIIFRGGIQLNNPVTTLPSASAANTGQVMTVSNSTTVVTEGQVCALSGSSFAIAISTGSVWKCF